MNNYGQGGSQTKGTVEDGDTKILYELHRFVYCQLIYA